ENKPIRKRTKRNEALYTDEVEILDTKKETVIDKDIEEEIKEDEALNKELEEEVEQLEDEMDMSFLSSKNNNIKEKTNSKTLIAIIIIICLLTFIIYHYTTFNHHKVKVVTKIKEVEKVPANYLFLGDSITDFYDLDKYYNDLPVVNSGISGNTTDDILNDMKKRAYQYNPSKVFLLIGTNDLIHNKSNEEIVEKVEKIIEEIKENRSKAEIYLQSIYPVNYKLSPNMVKNRKNDDIKEINEKLEDYCEDNDITYIDMYDLLKDKDDNFSSEYTKDGLHPNDDGYEVITKKLKKYLDK
ncbi:hypothetical protein EGP98_05285, partial [bacterium]|nr:hypothetical protein [bacterium]